MTYVLLFLANIVAGTINALAGGGGLITFPLLMHLAGRYPACGRAQKLFDPLHARNGGLRARTAG